MSIDLDQPCKQAEFAALVGISQPAVSDMLTRGLLKPGQPAQVWLLAYTRNLRDQAAGRGGDSALAENRAAESKTRNELLQLKLAERRGELVPVTVLEQVLAAMGAQVASQLEALPARIKTMVPELSPERVKQIEATIAEARNIAAATSMAILNEADPTGDEAGDRELMRE